MQLTASLGKTRLRVQGGREGGAEPRGLLGRGSTLCETVTGDSGPRADPECALEGTAGFGCPRTGAGSSTVPDAPPGGDAGLGLL